MMVDRFKAERLKHLLESETAKVRERQLKAGASTGIDSDSSGGLPSLPSDGEDEDVSARPHRVLDATATPTGGGARGGQEDQEEKIQELLLVLQEASNEIKKERQLNEALRDELERIKDIHEAEEERENERALLQEEIILLRDENNKLKQSIEPYKKKVCELSLTSALALEQLAMGRAKLAMAMGPFPPSPMPGLATASPPPVAPVPVVKPTVTVNTRRAASQSKRGSTRPRSVSPSSPHDKQQRQDQMMDRMRRAFAPPPKETMGLLVSSMVQELRRVMRERGTELPLERKGDCLYMLGNKKVNLAVSGGKLVVKSGGGHHDFLTFLEKYMHNKGRK